MDNLTKEELQQALERCASQPIHQPGTIQSHRFLLVLNQDWVIENVSENCSELLGVSGEI